MTASDDNETYTIPPPPDWVTAMSGDEQEAMLDQLRAQRVRPQWSPQDQIEGATGAFVASAARHKHDTNLHPLAVASLQNGRTGLRSLATAIGNAIGHPLSRGTATEILALSNAIGTDHLHGALREAATATLNARAATRAREIAAITRDTEVRDYRPTAIGTVDIGLSMPDAPSTSVFLALTPAMDAQEVRLYSTHGKLIISEQLLQNDEPDFLPNAIKAFGNAAERAEIRHIAKVLEGNQLPDQRPLFSAGNENLLAAADIDATGLGKATDALRSQSTEAGGQAGSAARALLVSPADEIDALRLVETLPQGRRPHVITLPFSGNSTWYLIADPEQSAALARLRMIGSAPSAISVAGLSPARWTDASGEIQSTPGLCLDLVHTVAIAPVSPVGVIRCTKS